MSAASRWAPSTTTAPSAATTTAKSSSTSSSSRWAPASSSSTIPASTPIDTSSSSASGIVHLQDGERVVPQSTRADGSVRKERKVRPGFTPVEDVTRYVPPRLRRQTPAATESKDEDQSNSVNSRKDKGVARSGKATKTTTPTEASTASNDPSGQLDRLKADRQSHARIRAQEPMAPTLSEQQKQGAPPTRRVDARTLSRQNDKVGSPEDVADLLGSMGLKEGQEADDKNNRRKEVTDQTSSS